MWKAILLFSFVVLAAAREKSQCEINNNVEEDDWKTLNADTTKPAEKMLCLYKCLYEVGGVVNSEGVLDVEKLIETTNKWKPLTDASKTSIQRCAKRLGPVKTCADVNPSFQCVHIALDKQKQEGTA